MGAILLIPCGGHLFMGRQCSEEGPSDKCSTTDNGYYNRFNSISNQDSQLSLKSIRQHTAVSLYIYPCILRITYSREFSKLSNKAVTIYYTLLAGFVHSNNSVSMVLDVTYAYGIKYRSSLFVGALDGFVYALPSLIEEEDIITEVSSASCCDCYIRVF